MNKLSWMIVAILFLSGCATTYELAQSDTPSATLKFTMDTDVSFLQTTALFMGTGSEPEKLPPEKACGGIEGLTKMAVIDKGNPLVTNFREDGLEVEAETNLLVQTNIIQPGFAFQVNGCGIITQFVPNEGDFYQLDALYNEDTCRTVLYKLGASEKTLVEDATHIACLSETEWEVFRNGEI